MASILKIINNYYINTSNNDITLDTEEVKTSSFLHHCVYIFIQIR